MRINWLGTTAVALVIGTGAVVAQTQTDQKREETPRAEQSKSKDANRPAAAQKGQAEQQKAQTAQPEPKAGAKEQRGEANTPQLRKQAQEPQHQAAHQAEPGSAEARRAFIGGLAAEPRAAESARHQAGG